MFTIACIIVVVAVLVVALVILMEDDSCWALGAGLGGVLVLSYGVTIVIQMLPVGNFGLSSLEIAVYAAAILIVLLVPLSIYRRLTKHRRTKTRRS